MYYKVAIFNTLQDFYYYTRPVAKPAIEPRIGDRVWVPFVNKQRLGIVIEILPKIELDIKLKNIDSLIDNEPLILVEDLNLLKWVAEYYKSPLPLVLKLAIPKNYREGRELSTPNVYLYNFNSLYTENYQKLLSKAKKQLKLANFVIVNPNCSKKQLLLNNFSSQELASLIKKNILIKTEVPVVTKNLAKTTKDLVLNPEQQIAVNMVSNFLNTYRCFLLKGVTGSGKTEVYLQIIRQVLANRKQVLVLVPEIGLTPQLLARFNASLATEIIVIHSGLNDSERQNAWQLAKEDKIKLVIGTRTAIFTPMPKLGLIVIDEEHDLSLKQMDGVRYLARDVAIKRAANKNIPIVLGSATPSLESFYNCLLNKYTLIELSTKALSKTPLHYQILDIRNQKLHNGFSKDTITQIGKHLESGNQVLVFINRRGFAPIFLCNLCGKIADCINCDTHLSYHRINNKLICHHCGYTIAKYHNCQTCAGDMYAIGVGTQRAFEYLSAVFPTNSILRIDKDEVAKKNLLAQKLQLINSQAVQIIVGTQMLAKGHHFPKLSLVVILDIDQGFYAQDFRNLERLGQLLIQVAGRAGREEDPGQVIIQTSLPNDPFLNVLIKQGYDKFVDLLLASRAKALLPPYAHLAILRAESNDTHKLLEFMHKIKFTLNFANLQILGPAPTTIFKKNKQYRMQLMLKSNSRKNLHNALNSVQEYLRLNKLPSTISFSIDVDPVEVA